MVYFNTGSVCTYIGNWIGWNQLPTNMSGTVLNDMVVQEINFVNTFTQDNVQTTNIDEKFQPSIIDLTLSKVMLATEAVQGGIDSASLGELTVSQAGGGGAELAKQLREDAIKRLKELGRSLRFKRIIGC